MKQMQTGFRRGLRTLTGATIALASGLTLAAEGLGLEEITVTARKREVSLQDAPLAVSVTTGEDFARSNIVRLDNFNGYVPGLTVAKNDGAGRVVTIRGIGWETAQNLSTRPSVLTYVDGIFLSNPLSLGLDLGDIERVEVFRGPQGTEFGQGTTGGAINIVTRKPSTEELSGSAEVGYGTFDTIRANGIINIPLSDTLAFRGSVQRYTRDGFAEIEGGALDGYDLDDADSTTAKLALLWEPRADLSILVTGSIFEADHNAPAQKNINDPNPDERELTQDFPGKFKMQNHTASIKIEWESPWGVVFKSLTGWQSLRKNQSVDGDRLTEDTIAIDIQGFGGTNNFDVLPFWENDTDAVSQEFNLTFSGERLNWTAGLFYLHDENFNDFLEATGPAPFSAARDRILNPSLANLPPFASELLFNEFRTVIVDAYAIYGQATYKLTDRLAVTGGLRWQYEDQQDKGAQFFGIFGGFDTKLDADKLTWKVGLDFDYSDNILLYGLVSTGWKNGGTNPGAVTNGALFLEDTFAPEELTAFEIGARTTFFDKRVRFNVTAFYYDHENLQFIFEDPVPFGGGTGTVPEAEEYGVETEFSWLINESWRIDGMLAWQDGKLKSDVFALDVADFAQALAPGVGLFTGAGFATRLALTNSTNLRGNEPAKMADITARLALTNNLRMGNGSELVSRLEWVHRGEFQARVFNNPLVDQVPSYDIVNLNFNYQHASTPLSFQLTLTNLFDKDGVNNSFTNPFGLWTTSEEFIPPREVIGSVKYTWN